MSQSLYDITAQFINIFNEIEELDGEITPELDEALKITKENYAQKLENYACVIQDFKADVVVLKSEIERLTNRKKLFENRIARLEARMLDAVLEYGSVETAKFKIGTRKSKTTEIDSERVTKLRNATFEFARDMYSNGYIDFGNVDLEGMLAVLNANIEAEWNEDYEGEFVPFTVDDLEAVKVNINSRSSIANLFTVSDGMLESVLNNEMRFNVDNDMSKTELSNELKIRDNITVGKIQENVKLSIK